MIKDANFIKEKSKITKELISEAVKLKEKIKLNEQDEQKDKVTFKFEFVGVTPGDTQKVYLKFNSPALSLALMNNKAKGGTIKYAYLSNFMQIAKNNLQTQTGINPLQFDANKSAMGDLLFSYNAQLSKTDLTQLVQIQPISVVVKVITGETSTSEPIQPSAPEKSKEEIPQKTVAQPKPSVTTPTKTSEPEPTV